MSIRKASQERGQVLILFCGVLLALSLAALTTIKLGWSLRDRVRLQNTADSAAYSMAVMEARAFNLYAYTNRAQASHYVSAMMWQSVISYWYGTEVFFVDAMGMVESTLGRCANGGTGTKAFCAAAAAIPGVGAFLAVMSMVTQGVRGLVNLYQRFSRTLDPDRTIGRTLIPLHRTMNDVLAGAGNAVMVSTLVGLQRRTEWLVKQNDPELEAGSLSTTIPINQCLFDRAHQQEASQTPLRPATLPLRPLSPAATRESDKVARAKRVMGQIANATRHGCDGGDCDPSFVTDRGLSSLRMPGNWEALKRWIEPVGSPGTELEFAL